MTKEVFLALLTEEGLSRWEAEGIWTAQVKAYPEQRCPPHGRQCPGAQPRDVARHEAAPRPSTRAGRHPPARPMRPRPMTDSTAPHTWDWRPPVERACPQCGTLMVEQKCKLTCSNCGASADCTDP